MELNQLPFDEKQQKAVLGHLLTDDRFFNQSRHVIQAEWWFSSQAGKLWDAKVRFFAEFSRCPSMPELYASRAFLEETQAMRNKMHSLAEECINETQFYKLDALAKQLTDWYHARLFMEGMNESQSLYNTGKVKDAYLAMGDKIHAIKTSSFEGTSAFDFSNYVTFVEQRDLDMAGALTLGMPEMDRLLLPQNNGAGSLLRSDTTVFLAPSNIGKCLGIDTPVMMADGTVRPVQAIVQGDLLMGPDGNPRRVLSTTRGAGPLFRVTPKSGGMSWVCNDVHVLSLKAARNEGRYRRDEIVNVPANEYVKKNGNYKNIMRLWRAGLEFEEKPLTVSPYILGLWLGDGHSDRAALTTADQEIASEWKSWVEGCGDIVREYTQDGNASRTYAGCAKFRGANRVSTQKLRDLGLINNKHIPHLYKTASRAQRLELLAGIIDTDGHCGGRAFTVFSKLKVLAEDYAYLARSLGLKASVASVTKTIKDRDFAGAYWQVVIQGRISEVPTRLTRKHGEDGQKDPALSGFRIESIGEGDYYGFTLDGDHLFLLGDFTVTHNTTSMITVLCANLRQRKSALLITHEGYKGDIVDKIWCNLLDCNRAEFYAMAKSKDPAIVARMTAVARVLQANLVYESMNKPGLTVEEVEAVVRRHQEERIAKHGKGFDLLVDDYPAKLGSMNMKFGQFQKRNLDEYVYNYFVQLALEYGFHCLLAIQANRTGAKINKGQKGYDDRLLTMEDVNESYGPCQIATNVITINRDPYCEALGYVIYFLSKSRSSETGWAVACKSNFAHAVTHSAKLGCTWYKGNVPLGSQVELMMQANRGQAIAPIALNQALAQAE